MNAKHKLSLIVAGALLAVSAGSAATSAEPAKRGPFDAKAREIFEKVISIPTQLGNRKVPELAAYLAGEFRAAGFPAEDITIVPFKLPDDATAGMAAAASRSCCLPTWTSSRPGLLTGFATLTSSSKRMAGSTAAARMT